ncbi:MAG: hypothetical protein ACOY30_01085 [Bacillota bacterium]
MLKRFLFFTGALTIFILGAYTQDAFRITPAVTALFRTMKVMAWDLYATFLARHLAEINTVSAFVALGGFSALLYFRFLSRAGKM